MPASAPGPVAALVTGIAEYQTRVTTGMADALGERGIPLLLVANESVGSEHTPSLVLELVRRRRVRGLIALADTADLPQRELPEALHEAGLPTVTLGARFAGAPRVRGDDALAVRHLMRHLLDERGVRRPVLIRGIPTQYDSRLREATFREELAARGMAVDEEFVLDGMFRPNDSYEAVRRLLARRRDFDAVVALNDTSAFGALSALTDHGLRVPDDVLLTGYDNTEGSQVSWPSLTTVEQGLREQGRRAVELLLGLTDGGPAEPEVVVPSRLVVRASTAPTAPVPPPEVARTAQGLQSRVALQDAALFLSWSMANCRTVDDVVTALDACLGRLSTPRCFLAIEDRHAAGDRTARLVLNYRGGRPHAVPAGAFPRHELLPPELDEELTTGVLLLQPLSIAGRERGYLLYEPPAESSILTEALRIDLPRTIDMVLSAQELQDHAATLEQLVLRRTQELEHANAELQRSARLDGLTGVANRSAFDERVQQVSDVGAEHLAVLMVDVDMFKAFNDRYGHLCGDHALRAVADCLLRAVRDGGDLVCRYGGEEFAVILPGAGTAEALGVARRFREALAELAIPHDASPVSPLVTASVGVAARHVRDADDATRLIAAADAALYLAKGRGRDRIAMAAGTSRVPRQPGADGLPDGADELGDAALDVD